MSDLPDREALDHPDVRRARRRAGQAVRDLGHALVGHHASVATLEQVAAQLEHLTARLSVGGSRSRGETTFGYTWAEAPTDGSVMDSWPDRPVTGAASPWGMDVVVRREGPEAIAHLQLRAAHEGAPGRSHGGIVAAVFDDLMGYVLQLEQRSAFTGELTVRYQAPVPVHEPLEVRARLREHTGRKLLIDAEMSASGRVVARATAIFITVEGFVGA